METNNGLIVKLESVTNLLTKQQEPGLLITNCSDETLTRLQFLFSYQYGDGELHQHANLLPTDFDGFSTLGIELLGVDEVLEPGCSMESPIFNSDEESIRGVRSALDSVSIDDCSAYVSGAPEGAFELNIQLFAKLFRQHFGN